jgi:hypothetical protein
MQGSLPSPGQKRSPTLDPTGGSDCRNRQWLASTGCAMEKPSWTCFLGAFVGSRHIASWQPCRAADLTVNSHNRRMAREGSLPGYNLFLGCGLPLQPMLRLFAQSAEGDLVIWSRQVWVFADVRLDRCIFLFRPLAKRRGFWRQRRLAPVDAGMAWPC